MSKMRLHLRRIASTLLFGLACSLLTALHFSNKRLPNGEQFQSEHLGIETEKQAPGIAAEERRRLPRLDEKNTGGVRLQRGVAWVVDESGSDSYNLQQNNGRTKVDLDIKNSVSKHPAHLPAPPLVTDRRPLKTNASKLENRTVIFSIQNSKSDQGTNDSVQTNSLLRTELLQLDDIFIGVKTTAKNHKTRLQLVLDTWQPLAQKQTYFFTDQDDPYKQRLGDYLINTKCPSLHARQALCCKVAIMYDMFLKSGKRWFCHLDDDNYLNVHNLLRLLRGYDHRTDLYLGRVSLAKPIQALDRDRGFKQTSFWFATGGAGFCISQSLAVKMAPLAGEGRFIDLCDRVRLPDDVTMGFAIESLLKVPLTKLDVFNSHLQGLNRIKESKLPNQVTLSYYISASRSNTITLKDGLFTKEQDPTRLRSLHCKLYPETPNCLPRITR